MQNLTIALKVKTSNFFSWLLKICLMSLHLQTTHHYNTDQNSKHRILSVDWTSFMGPMLFQRTCCWSCTADPVMNGNILPGANKGWDFETATPHLSYKIFINLFVIIIYSCFYLVIIFYEELILENFTKN